MSGDRLGRQPAHGRFRRWLRNLAPIDLDDQLARARHESVAGSSRLPLGEARLYRAERVLDLTALDLNAPRSLPPARPSTYP